MLPAPSGAGPGAQAISVVGSLAARLDEWDRVGLSPWVRRLVASGFRLLWGGVRPTLSSVPPPFCMPADLEVRQALDGEVRTLVQKGAVEGVRYASFPGFYDLLFTFLKASGGQRPVLALFTSQGFPSESLASGWRRCRTFGQRFVLEIGGPPST